MQTNKTFSDTGSSDVEEGIEVPRDQFRYESRSTSAAASPQSTSKAPQQDPPTTCSGRIKCLAFVAFIAIGLIVGLSLILTGRPNPVSFFVPVDPPGSAEANRWDATAGLNLMVENACTDDWTPYFEASINEWSASQALTLRTSKVAVDPECSPRMGRLKVCNGDYGDTEWHGINIILVNDQYGTIVYSYSKLNDRFMDNEFDRAYIMCHENGHGFGLPHTDVDHFNRDRGDCMDYTIRPQNNLIPGDFNLNLLVELYGTSTNPLAVDPKLLPKEGETASATGGNTNNDNPNTGNNQPRPPQNNDKEEKDKNKDRRHLQYSSEELDEVDLIALEQEAVLSCEEEHCDIQISKTHRVIVSQFRGPKSN